MRLLILSIPILLAAAANAAEQPQKLETAIVAGGCFWCIESDFEKLNGVVDVVSGYTGGHVRNPTYHQVSAGNTGHIESAEITYDANIVDYTAILDYFWHHIDPTRDDGQFCDKGNQYRPAIFYLDQAQKNLAEASRERIDRTKPFKAPLKVELIQASTFYPAEEYHQDYYKKNPLRYRYYRYSCGRDDRVESLWGSD